MSAQYSSKLSLLLPVYNGGELFLGAVASIEQSAIPFDKIVISFNGDRSDDFDAFHRLQEQGILTRKYTIFRTNQDLSAAQHGKFALEHMLDLFHEDESIMFLAHDDRILTTQVEEDMQRKFVEKIDAHTVYFPSYHCCQAGFYDEVTHILERELKVTAEEFFWLTMRESVPTNMSGMVVPFWAWVEALKAVERNKNGARFEHLLCVGSTVRGVEFTKSIKMLIGARVDSDGKSLTEIQHRKAAFNYALAYWRNGHLREARRVLPFFYQLLRKGLAYFIASAKTQLAKSHGD